MDDVWMDEDGRTDSDIKLANNKLATDAIDKNLH